MKLWFDVHGLGVLVYGLGSVVLTVLVIALEESELPAHGERRYTPVIEDSGAQLLAIVGRSPASERLDEIRHSIEEALFIVRAWRAGGAN